MSASGYQKSTSTPTLVHARAGGRAPQTRGLRPRSRATEDRELVLVLPAGVRADQHLAEPGLDVVGADRSFRRRDEVVTGLVQARLAQIGEERAVRDRLRIELSGSGDARADGVHMRAAREPPLLDDRLGRRGGGADDLGTKSAGRQTARAVAPTRQRRLGGFDASRPAGSPIAENASIAARGRVLRAGAEIATRVRRGVRAHAWRAERCCGYA